MSLKSYQNCCRFCFNNLGASCFDLHEYFEDLYYEITGKKLISSDLLSRKFCFLCNNVLASMTSIVNNQDKLFDLMYGKIQNPIKQENPAKTTIYDDCSTLLALETVLIKEEPAFASCEKLTVKAEKHSEVISIEDSDDDQEEIIQHQIQGSSEGETFEVQVYEIEPNKKVDKPPKPKKLEPESERFCPYEKCQKLFSTKRIMNQHVLGVHKQIKRFRCKFPNCGYSAYQRSNVRMHQIHVHKLPNPISYFCEECGLQFSKSGKLKHHRNSKHLNIRNFVCDYCGRRFYDKRTLRNHIQTHMVSRKLTKCDFPGCTKEFVSSFTCRYHKKVVHEKILSFVCHCGKKFGNKPNLINHQKFVHEKVKKAYCEICDKRFTTVEFLKNHKLSIHPANGQKPSYPCEVCSKTFTFKSSLSSHMKVHSNPEFVCEHCSKKFYQKFNLLDHMEKHIKLAFPCLHCNRSFRASHMLKCHLIKIHFKEKQTYRCEICSSTFTRRTTCRDHVLKQHKDISGIYREELLERISGMMSEEKAEKLLKENDQSRFHEQLAKT